MRKADLVDAIVTATGAQRRAASRRAADAQDPLDGAGRRRSRLARRRGRARRATGSGRRRRDGADPARGERCRRRHRAAGRASGRVRPSTAAERPPRSPTTLAMPATGPSATIGQSSAAPAGARDQGHSQQRARRRRQGNRRRRRRRGRDRDAGEAPAASVKAASGQGGADRGERARRVQRRADRRRRAARPPRRGLRLPAHVGYLAGRNDAYVSASQVRRFGLRKGDYVKGATRPPASSEKYPALVRVDVINGMSPDEARSRVRFEDLTPLFPDSQAPARARRRAGRDHRPR